jgi:hypothetical protein
MIDSFDSGLIGDRILPPKNGIILLCLKCSESTLSPLRDLYLFESASMVLLTMLSFEYGLKYDMDNFYRECWYLVKILLPVLAFLFDLIQYINCPMLLKVLLIPLNYIYR